MVPRLPAQRVGAPAAVTGRPVRVVADWAVQERPAPTSSDPFRAKPTYRVPQLPPGYMGAGGGFLAENMPENMPAHILALVHGYVPAHGSGAEHMLHALLRDSVRRGHKATVVCANAGATGAYEVDGVEVWPRAGLADALTTADVMIAHLAWSDEAVKTAAAHDIPLVYLFHNDNQIRYWMTYLQPPSVTVAVWNSVWVRDRLAGQAPAPFWLGGWPGPGAVVRPPCLLEDYGIPEDPDPRGFVTLVNVQHPKGSTIFYALADRTPHRFLGVAGAYGEQVHPGADHPNVAWQPQTGDMRGDVYARTRVLLVPSEYESWGRCAIEAMCAGIPVVAAPTPGLLESLGEAAIFVELRAGLEAWMAALDILDDPRTYAQWSRKARERAAFLDRQSQEDLGTWDDVIRASAAAGRVHSPA